MNIRSLLLFSAAVSLAATAEAQTLPAKCEASMPSALNSPIVSKTDIEILLSNNYGQEVITSKRSRSSSSKKSHSSSGARYWDVISDRCDNTLYNEPRGKKNGRTLSFGQRVRIAQIEGGYALVYTEPNPGAVNFPQISNGTEALGWIPMDHLLLWEQCPVNQQGTYPKALVVNNIDTRSGNIRSISWNPSFANTTHVRPLQVSPVVHYIMKSEENESGTMRYLLASAPTCSGTTAVVIDGWVSAANFVAWNDRACLEPTWDDTDVSYYARGNEQAFVYADPDLLHPVQGWVFGTVNDQYQPATQYRMAPRIMRLPIIEGDSRLRDHSYRVVAFGTKDGLLGVEQADVDPETVNAGVGYVAKDNGDEHDYWQTVLLFSQAELAEFVKSLEPLKAAVKTNSYSSSARHRYVKALAEVLQHTAGMSASAVEQLTVDDVTRLIAGLTPSTPLFRGHFGDTRLWTLEQINNPKVCPDDEFKKIVKRTAHRLDQLTQIAQSLSFKYRFTQGAQESYWIPLSMIP